MPRRGERIVPERRIVEGISGLWHYHVAEHGTNAKALCGARTMSTEMKLADWGKPFGEHLPKRPTWCKTCAGMLNLPYTDRGGSP